MAKDRTDDGHEDAAQGRRLIAATRDLGRDQNGRGTPLTLFMPTGGHSAAVLALAWPSTFARADDLEVST